MTFHTLAAFEVLGVPAPQGSHSAVVRGGRAVIIPGSSTTGRVKHRDWRTAVANAARDVASDAPYDGALSLSVMFRMPMPASRPKRDRALGRIPCIVRPDADKCLRATLDGLTAGGLIVDDARVFAVEVEQWEVTSWTGAEIVLRRWETP